MSTPLHDALVAKVRDYANKPEVNTIPNSIIKDCLKYAADECYRVLRIPPLEATTTYTIGASDNEGENSLGMPYGNAYTTAYTPDDLTQFIYVRTLAQENSGTPYSTFPSNISKVFHEVTDARTFFDAYAEKFSVYNWMWKGDKLFIHPQLAINAVLEIHYYRRLPALDATYDVVPYNYLVGLSDADQAYLTLTGVGTDTPLYFAEGIPYATYAEAETHGVVTTKYYVGKEVDNWLRDQNERLLIWGALQYLGAYLFDDKMEARYEKRFQENMFSLNKEEKWRRASGGNVQVNFNSGGLI